MRDWLIVPSSGGVTMQEIVRAVAREWHVSVTDILGARRRADLAWPRHVAMYLSAHDSRRSYPQIGRYFERDHTTIMHAESRVERVIAGNKTEARRIEKVKESLAIVAREREAAPQWRRTA